jgi:hypothetical protein
MTLHLDIKNADSLSVRFPKSNLLACNAVNVRRGNSVWVLFPDRVEEDNLGFIVNFGFPYLLGKKERF